MHRIDYWVGLALSNMAAALADQIYQYLEPAFEGVVGNRVTSNYNHHRDKKTGVCDAKMRTETSPRSIDGRTGERD